jgi:hypothetical protein
VPMFSGGAHKFRLGPWGLQQTPTPLRKSRFDKKNRVPTLVSGNSNVLARDDCVNVSLYGRTGRKDLQTNNGLQIETLAEFRRDIERNRPKVSNSQY